MIICVGTTPAMARSIAFDSLKLDDVNRAAAVVEYAAGKNVNVARVLTTLGEPAAAVGFLGGSRAAAMRADLDLAYISHAFLDVDAPTRLCVTVIDRAAQTATELIEEPGAVAPRDSLSLLKKLNDLVATASLLVLSGSLAPGVPTTFYRDCIALAAQHNVRSIVDAAGEPLTKSLEAKPFLVKPNREELARTLGRPIDSDDALRQGITDLIAAGPTWAAVTLGKDGSIISDGKEFWRITVPAIQAISAIGSGDSFAAGMAAGVARGQPLPDAARLAAACGAANALTDRAGHLTRKDVTRLREQTACVRW